MVKPNTLMDWSGIYTWILSAEISRAVCIWELYYADYWQVMLKTALKLATVLIPLELDTFSQKGQKVINPNVNMSNATLPNLTANRPGTWRKPGQGVAADWSAKIRENLLTINCRGRDSNPGLRCVVWRHVVWRHEVCNGLLGRCNHWLDFR